MNKLCWDYLQIELLFQLNNIHSTVRFGHVSIVIVFCYEYLMYFKNIDIISNVTVEFFVILLQSMSAMIFDWTIHVYILEKVSSIVTMKYNLRHLVTKTFERYISLCEVSGRELSSAIFSCSLVSAGVQVTGHE